MGRLDDQVKLRGQRIDVGEIASIVTRSGLAGSSVVLPVSRGKGAPKQLAVFYTTLSNNTTPSNTESNFRIAELGEVEMEIQAALFAALETLLPSYMVPSYLVPISCIPMTSSGKIEKKLLASAFTELSHEFLEKSTGVARATQGDSATMSTEEGLVVEAISAALRVDKSLIGRWTPLASVGLDSITAISVAKHLSETLGKKAAISVILQNPHVAQLASVLSEEKPRKPRETRNGTHPNGPFISDGTRINIRTHFEQAGGIDIIEAVLPCTPLQEAMLAAKDDATYYNSMVLRLNASPHAVQASWEAMCERHGILRTCFMSMEDPRQPFVQAVLKKFKLPWHSALPGSTTERYLEYLRSSMAASKDSSPP
ncbi:hypothetical protein IMZ48_00150, partial [Candidatus Bathyarchaeota archaeon]|nr:hypothetical protein [Candidatus Bathyarchaeota archaeon]